MFADPLKVLKGKDIKITDQITVHQPTIDEIEAFGERKFFSTFYTLCSIPSDMKSALWDKKIDWTKISDYDFFIMLSKGFSQNETEIVLPDVDLSKMEIESYNGKTLLISPDGKTAISEEIYVVLIEYIREFLGYIPKVEKYANKITRDVFIKEDRKRRKKNAGKPFESIIHPMIITLVNTEEFPYNYETVFNTTLYQLTKSYYQIDKKKKACALLQGSMSGFIDSSKIKRSSLDWSYKSNTGTN